MKEPQGTEKADGEIHFNKASDNTTETQSHCAQVIATIHCWTSSSARVVNPDDSTTLCGVNECRYQDID
jgi:hypothetical protein